ncbi:hypothetical protein GTA08_BOTSDO01389 [Botryosphaeria dothidea]|uniref:CID domain-containing protein n=1 Tax=Botryosphaeria dothidea TaxID=55169 RepID=A0A8H4N9A2_9PEZI|nr:hypothetical protein GTA08_BOTSDO01389 [Botryosphaeria dothidea]
MAATRAPAAPTAPASLVVAKTMLTATLLRPDPTQVAVAKDDIQSFHSLLDAVVLTCSPSNLQNCKEWLLKNIVTSNKRADALGKYLARLAQSFAESQAPRKPSKRSAPSSRRKTLHLLYLLNDLMHHVRVHDGPLADLTKTLEPHIDRVFTTALSLQLPNKSKFRQRLAKLTELYEDKTVYSEGYRDRICRTLRDASVPNAATAISTQYQPASTSKEAPYILPAFHGEPNDPWYDLPAGALMPHIRPNDPRPINPHNIKAVDLRHKTAEIGLTNAVKDLLNYSEGLYNEDEGIVADIDMMGQPLVRDEVTGELNVTEGYYGWSVEFCERMKKRRKETKSRANRNRGYRRSPPPSRNGPSQSPPFPQQHSAPGQPFPPFPPPLQFPTFPPNFQPPPPPSNFQGPWPPPPPPPMGPNGSYNQPFPPFPPQPNMPMGFVPPPPPNYPPGQQWQQHQQPWGPPGSQQQGSGHHWNQNNGYDRGRGRRY